MVDSHDFPTELAHDPADTPDALRWTCGVLAVTALALALLNAGAVASWADELAPTPSTTMIVAVADAWDNTTKRLAFDGAHARLRTAWKRAEATRWSRQSAAAARST